MRRSTRLPSLFALAVLAFAPGARAAVFLNGTNIDGAPLNQKLENCSVTLDGHGNVLITAPGYQVQVLPPSAGAPSAQPPPLALTKKYFVVSEQSTPGITQYDIDLYVNSKWIRKFHSDDDQVVAEVSQYLHPGPNRVLFVAKKNIVGARKSASPDATYRITLGEGDASSDKVVIDTPLLTFKRSADQTEDTSQEFAVQGR